MTQSKLGIKNFSVTSWHTHPAVTDFKDIGCPERFTGRIQGTGDLPEIVDAIAREIKRTELPHGIEYRVFDFGTFGTGGSRISSWANDSKNNVAGFVLLSEQMYSLISRGMSWQEGCYGIRVARDAFKGKLLGFNQGAHIVSHGQVYEDNPNSRLIVRDIENGVLKYSHLGARAPENGENLECDLRKL